MASFADVQYIIYADKVGRWGRKRLRICWRNTGMVPIQFKAEAPLNQGGWLMYADKQIKLDSFHIQEPNKIMELKTAHFGFKIHHQLKV